MLNFRTSNFQGAIIKLIVPRYQTDSLPDSWSEVMLIIVSSAFTKIKMQVKMFFLVIETSK